MQLEPAASVIVLPRDADSDVRDHFQWFHTTELLEKKFLYLGDVEGVFRAGIVVEYERRHVWLQAHAALAALVLQERLGRRALGTSEYVPITAVSLKGNWALTMRKQLDEEWARDEIASDEATRWQWMWWRAAEDAKAAIRGEACRVAPHRAGSAQLDFLSRAERAQTGMQRELQDALASLIATESLATALQLSRVLLAAHVAACEAAAMETRIRPLALVARCVKGFAARRALGLRAGTVRHAQQHAWAIATLHAVVKGYHFRQHLFVRGVAAGSVSSPRRRRRQGASSPRPV